jgi:hypothetical protein
MKTRLVRYAVGHPFVRKKPLRGCSSVCGLNVAKASIYICC